jgi:hypothetical protein
VLRSALRRRWHDEAVFLYAFDLIELNGDDLRREPLEVRKATLASVLAKAAAGLRLNEHIEADGPIVFAHACKMGPSCPSARRRATALAAHPTGSSRRTQLAPRCGARRKKTGAADAAPVRPASSCSGSMAAFGESCRRCRHCLAARFDPLLPSTVQFSCIAKLLIPSPRRRAAGAIAVP